MPYIREAIPKGTEATFISEALSAKTVERARGYDAVSIFTSDDAQAGVLKQLKIAGVRFVVVRAAGYDNVDIQAANSEGVRVANVPEYSPHAVAEHAGGADACIEPQTIRPITRCISKISRSITW